jgi:hypothetical protein
MTEDISFEDEYEEYMKGLGWSDEGSSDGPLFGGPSTWQRFPEEFAADIADGISDSESIVSIGDLGDDARLMESNRDDGEMVNENMHDWVVG